MAVAYNFIKFKIIKEVNKQLFLGRLSTNRDCSLFPEKEPVSLFQRVYSFLGHLDQINRIDGISEKT